MNANLLDLFFVLLMAVAVTSLLIDLTNPLNKSSDDESLNDLNQEPLQHPAHHDEQQEELDNNQKD